MEDGGENQRIQLKIQERWVIIVGVVWSVLVIFNRNQGEGCW